MIDRQVFVVVESGEESTSTTTAAAASTNSTTSQSDAASENTSNSATPLNRSVIMPAKQTGQTSAAGGGDSIVLGVEELVHEIKENLRLKARPSHSSRNSRPSPYHIPCRSWADATSSTTSGGDKQQVQKPKKEELDDPYELLQTLLKGNNLVKEAVRRLQLNYSPKQRMFYDSDEDSSRSPIIRMCQLEL